MSGDEVFVLVIAIVLGSLLWSHWLWVAASVAPRLSKPRDRRPLVFYPMAGAVLLFGVLKGFASFDVRDSWVYLFFYMAMGAAWVAVGLRFLGLFGLSGRDDVVERGNRAAGQAIGGGILGITLCFAGANIGDGPGWWVVVFSAGLSTVTFFVLWVILEKLTHLADTVTIDRDPSAGVRLAGFFTGTGLILGRAVAGDWVSAGATVRDFAVTAWPALVLLALAAFLERRLRPSREQPFAPAASGLPPAAVYVGLAVLWLVRLRWWS
ncbi:MAG TPA: hypothetical protein VEL74_02510 [Thermoanaerobaculia bacterium]|nr:hypothetical protein [Thermoanaerobaculia bacterium]